ncbi:MAG: BrnA antitoxin family protein [Phyllobacteriaceae bacterium]|nr:BrnA antitoxin family protein [Phyllobacteriaceae bacterium]
MQESKRDTRTDWVDPDDAPDMSTPYWQARFDAVLVQRGRPRVEQPKVSTTIRLDADVIEHFKAGGKGWQTRINAALRRAIEKG